MKRIKNKKLNIFLTCLLVTALLMISKKANIIKNIGKTLKIRKLDYKPEIDYICNKAGNSLMKKYSKGYDEKIFETKQLTKAQNAIINYGRDSKYEYIKDYYYRIVIFFIFLVLDIIFIFCWISCCCCCCCSCCCFKTANPSSYTLRLVFFLISAICNFLVIIFSIIALCQIEPFIKRINGIACSYFKFLDHIKDGLGTSYPKVSKPWIGLLGIRDLLDDTQRNYNLVLDNSELEQNIQYAKSNYSELEPDTCGIKSIVKEEDFENEMNNLDNLTNSSFSSIDFQEQIDNFDEAYNKFNDMEDDICGNVYDALHDYINNYVKKYFILFFVITLIFGFLGLLFLILYYLSKINGFRIVYIIIWNISMLLMLLSILIGISFGLLGTFLHDGVRIVQYILSEDNLYSEDPLFIKTDLHVSDLINTCINEEGEFLNVIQENEEIKKNIDNFKQKSIKYNNTITDLSNLNCNDENSKVAQNTIINVYNLLLVKSNIVQNMSSNLTELNCRFVGNDERIILNEFDLISKKGLLICACCLLIGLLFGMSVLSGILFVHRYKYTDELERNMLNKTYESTSKSTSNINETNNQNNLPLNNNDKGKDKIYNN